MQFVCACHFSCLHFEQGHEERKRRFRSLVLINAVGMKAVSAAACCWVIKGYLQIVLSEEPAEDALGFLKPLVFFRQPVNLQASGNGCAGLHWLLIEPR